MPRPKKPKPATPGRKPRDGKAAVERLVIRLSDAEARQLRERGRRAAAMGCLLWTAERITTTDSSRIDARAAVADVER